MQVCRSFCVAPNKDLNICLSGGIFKGASTENYWQNNYILRGYQEQFLRGFYVTLFVSGFTCV